VPGQAFPAGLTFSGESTMRTAIDIGGRVLSVDVERVDRYFKASVMLRIRGQERRIVGMADSYDGALGELKRKIAETEGSHAP
jgi:hypothetical protein